jgi:glycosyltransferase 2 family protein
MSGFRVKRAAARVFSSRITQILLGLVVGFLCLYLALRGVDWSEVQRTILKADPFYISLAFGVTLVNIALKILRWQVQLKPERQNIRLAAISASFLSAQMLNAVIPIRLGEVQRIYVIGGSGSTHGFVLGTIVAEKFLDMLAYAVLIGILLLWIPLPKWMGGSVTALVGITLIQAVLLFILALKRDTFLVWVERLSRHFSERIREFLLKNVRTGFASLAVFRQPASALKLSLVTASIWSAAVLANYWVLLALDIQAPLAASLLVLVAVQAGISLPSLPGKIGVFELTCILALEIFGVSRANALSYGILLHAVVFIPILVPGLISYLYLQIEGLPRVSQ